MKLRIRLLPFSSTPFQRLAALLLFATPPLVTAQTTLTWGPNGSGFPLGGDGIWSTAGAPYWTPDNGATYQNWPDPATAASAIFSGTAGTVTLGSSISTSGLTFNTTGYTINGGGTSLTLTNDSSGFGPKIFVSGANVSATINAPLAGTAGVTVAAGGTLILGGASTLTGGINIANAAVRLMSAPGSFDPSNLLAFGEGLGDTGGGGGAFVFDNTGATGATSQTLSGAYFYGGDSTVQTNRVASQDLSLTFNSQVRSIGATVNYVVNGGVNGVENRINISGATPGFFDQGAAFFNGSSYAWLDSAGYVRGINYGVDAGSVTTSGTTSITGTYVQATGNITAQDTATFSTLKLSGASNLTLADGQTVTVNGLLKAGGGAATISGGTSISAGSDQDLVVRTDQLSDSLTISSVIAANGFNSLTKSGAGTLTLTATNVYTGDTFLNGGTLSVASLPAGAGNSTIGTGGLRFSGGTLQYTGGSVTTSRSFTGLNGGGGIEITQSGTTLTISSAFIGANVSLATDAIVKSGAGTLALSSNTDNSGLGFMVNAGTLQLAKTSGTFVHAVSQQLIVNNGGVVQLAGIGGDQIENGSRVTVNTGGVFNFNGRNEGFESLFGGGSVTNNSTTASSTMTLGTNNDVTTYANFNGTISNGSSGRTIAVSKTGSGTQVFSGTNTYTGGTTISGGTLQLGDGSTSNGSVAGNITNNATLAFANPNAQSYSGVISGGGSVFKSGAGTLTLTGASTYTGATTISAGTLSLDNNNSTTARLTATSGITLNAGGTLLFAQSGGTASTNRVSNSAPLTLAGGRLNLNGKSEGAAGTTGIGALTLTSTSIIDFGLTGSSNLIRFGGLGSHTAGAVLQILDWEGTAGSASGIDRLLFAGTSSSFTNIFQQSEVSFNGAGGYGVQDFGSYYEVYGITPVPEPTTVLGGFLALGALGYSQRQRLGGLLAAAHRLRRGA